MERDEEETQATARGQSDEPREEAALPQSGPEDRPRSDGEALQLYEV
jgi:hypothetical protein